MKKKNVLAMVMVSLLVLGFVVPSFAGRSHKFYAQDICCGYTNDNAPVFIDPLTGDEWFGVESRLCENGMWGVDTLYERLNAYGDVETTWVCHGFMDIDLFLADDLLVATEMQTADVHTSESFIGIVPFNGQCPIGCPTFPVQTVSSQNMGVMNQRLCTHGLWGIDVEYRIHVTTIIRCSKMGTLLATSVDLQDVWSCNGTTRP